MNVPWSLAVLANGTHSRSKSLGGHFMMNLASYYGLLTPMMVAQLHKVWMKLYSEHKLIKVGDESRIIHIFTPDIM